MTASWNETTPASEGTVAEPNEAVIWDTIITSPSADHLANLGKIAKRKLLESGKGKTVDSGRYALFPTHVRAPPLGSPWSRVATTIAPRHDREAWDEKGVRDSRKLM